MDQIRGRSEPATIMSDPRHVRLTKHIIGIDRTDAVVETTVPVERALKRTLTGLRAGLHTSWLYRMTRTVGTIPSLSLEKGAFPGCVLCLQGEPVCYMEDVGRYNAVDKPAGWMYRHGIDPADKILYTTGKLTTEMAIKTIRMGIPILVSLWRFTALGRVAGAAGQAEAGRSGTRQALYRPFRRAADRLPPGYRDDLGRAREQAQGSRP